MMEIISKINDDTMLSISFIPISHSGNLNITNDNKIRE